MRARQFIVEYNQAKTAEVFGDKLLAALALDGRTLPSLLGTARAYLQQKSKISSPIESQARATILSDILSTIESADSTHNKAYVPWLVRCYANEGIKMEDILSRGKDWTEYYTKLKLKKIIPGTSRDANIMNLKFRDLWDVITNPEYVEKMQAAEQAALPKGKSQVAINNSVVRVIIPHDVESAVYYGQGTQWCTAARNNNMFDRYNNQGQMYIFLPKQPEYEGEKYQIHPESGSFMNEQDVPVDPVNLLTVRFGDLLQWFKWNDPNLKKMLVFADDSVLDKALSEIKEIAYEYINDKVYDWEANDDTYHQSLDADGFADEDGNIDWERAPGYLEYNYDAKEEYDRLIELVNLNSTIVKQVCQKYSEDVEESPTFKSLDNIVAYIINSNRDRYGNIESNDAFAEWIQKNVAVDMHGQVTRVSISRTGKAAPR